MNHPTYCSKLTPLTLCMLVALGCSGAPQRGAGEVHSPPPPLPTVDPAPEPQREPPPTSAPPPAPPSAPAATRAPAPRRCPAGAPQPLNRVRIMAAPGQAAQLVGARIQGSNSGPTTDFVDLATIEQPPREGELSELRFENDVLYRFVKYYAPAGSQGGLAELEFYHDDERLDGAPFGTPGKEPRSGFSSVFDRDPASVFSGATNGGNYVGIDLGGSFVVEPPTVTPAALTRPGTVKIASKTLGAKVRYTLDGSAPSRAAGDLYRAPIRVAADLTLRALAYADCLFDSPITTATYSFGKPAQARRAGAKSYHVGNSLTDTINHWLEPIADSTGVDHSYARWTIPGAPIGWIYEHKGDGFGTPEEASKFDSFVRSYAPIDHFSLQPFADPDLESQGRAAIELAKAVQSHSPEVQLWVYAQWPSKGEWSSEAFANGASYTHPPWLPPSKPSSWDEATRNHALYHETFRNHLDDAVDGKRVLIVPAGLALLALKAELERGAVPGMKDFFKSLFEDDLHLTKPGQYFVGLVFYACFYKQSPVNRATFADSGLTAEQALVFQRVAWEAAQSYPLSGIR